MAAVIVGLEDFQLDTYVRQDTMCCTWPPNDKEGIGAGQIAT